MLTASPSPDAPGVSKAVKVRVTPRTGTGQHQLRCWPRRSTSLRQLNRDDRDQRAVLEATKSLSRAQREPACGPDEHERLTLGRRAFSPHPAVRTARLRALHRLRLYALAEAKADQRGETRALHHRGKARRRTKSCSRSGAANNLDVSRQRDRSGRLPYVRWQWRRRQRQASSRHTEDHRKRGTGGLADTAAWSPGLSEARVSPRRRAGVPASKPRIQAR